MEANKQAMTNRYSRQEISTGDRQSKSKLERRNMSR